MQDDSSKQQFVEDDEIEIDLRSYLRVLVKRRWQVLAAFLIVVLVVAIRDLTAVPYYESTVRLVIEKQNQNVVSIQEVMAADSTGTDYYQTQYKIIESRTIIRKVMDTLNLWEHEEFNPKASDNFIANSRRAISETIGGWKDGLLGLLNRSEPVVPMDDDSESVLSAKQRGLISAFASRLTISPIRNSRLVDVTFSAKNPALAATIANTLAQTYIDHTLNVRLDAIKDAMAFLNDRIGKERKVVDQAEVALQEYREANQIVTEFSGDVETVTAQKLAQLNSRVVEAESNRVALETKYTQALTLKNNPSISNSIPEVIHNPLIQEIKKAEVDIYGRISDLSKKYGAAHPRMLAAQSELQSLQEKHDAEVLRIIDSLRNEFEVARATELSLKNSLSRQKAEALELNKKAIEYGILKRQVESAREMYGILIQRFKETSVTEDINTSNIRIVDLAEPSRIKATPQVRRDLMLAMALGLMLGVGLAFFWEYMDNTIKTPDELEKYLGVSSLGLIPNISTDKDTGDSSDHELPEMVTINAPKSQVSEAYRSLRTRILFSSAGKAPKVILCTSATAQEGKTLSSANLAATMAQSGSRVLLIDCDLRRPRLHKIFKISRDRGISNVLVGDCPIDDVIIPTSLENLSMVPCGPIPPNPSELLGSLVMQRTLEELGTRFDRIILDTPPITAVTDAVLLGRFVDGVVLVVRAHKAAREMVSNALKHMAGAKAHILGAVLNGVSMDKNAYYYQYYYYSGYYHDDQSSRKKKKRKVKRS